MMLWALSATLLLSMTSGVRTAQAQAPACGTATNGTHPEYPTSASPAKATCATFSDYLPDGSVSFCRGIVDYPYYLPDTYTQIHLENAALASLTEGSSVPQSTAALLLAMLPQKCAAQIKRTVCLAAFQACEMIDPFFLDTTCLIDQKQCTSCGALADISTQGVAPFSVAPGYGSVCTDGMSTGTAALCTVGPGKVPGAGNMGWESYYNLIATMAPGSVPPTIEGFCAVKNLVWSAEDRACMAVIPRSPCKSECDATVRMDTVQDSACPVVTGMFDYLLQQWKHADPTNDEYLRAQVDAVNATGLGNGLYTVSLLGVLGLRPQCSASADGRYSFAKEYTLEDAPHRAMPVGFVIKSIAEAYAASPLGDTCHCTVNAVSGGAEQTSLECTASKGAGYCAKLAGTISRCNAGGGQSVPAPSLAFAADHAESAGGRMPDACVAHLTHPSVQPDATTSAILAAGYGNKSVGVFYVPPTVGQPLFVSSEPQPKNAEGQALCSSRNAVNGLVSKSDDSLSCVMDRVQGSIGAVPTFLRGECRAAYLQFLCGTAYMKPEFKSMCLTPDGKGGVSCGATDVSAALSGQPVPFTFALPRFLSNDVCLNVRTKCKDFITSLGEIGTPRRDAFEAAVDCGKNVDQTCDSNVDGWKSNVWSCSSPFNAFKNYPTGKGQQLADVTSLLLPYLTAVGISPDVATEWGFSHSINGTLNPVSDGSSLVLSNEYCSCPAPLLVPADPNEETLSEQVCCQQSCVGHMYQEDFYTYVRDIQNGLAATSLILSSFVFVTWLSFKSKRSQGLTLYFSIAVMNITLLFLIPNNAGPLPWKPGGAWCETETLPKVQADGGMCVFQAIWITYWTLCAVFWWFSQALDLWLKVALGRRHVEYLGKWYHVVSWITPMVVVAIHLGTESYGYSRSQVWCFVHDGAGIWSDLGLFYGIVVTVTFAGTVLMLHVLYRIWQITSRTQSHLVGGNQTGKKLAVYRTPVTFVLIFVYIWVSIFGWRFSAEVARPKIAEGAAAWIQCLLLNYAAGIPDPATSNLSDVTNLLPYGVTPGSGCGENYPVAIAKTAIYYIQGIAASTGIFFFLIYGLKLENFHLWSERLGMTSRKYDTTDKGDSTTNDRGAKRSFLSFMSIGSGTKLGSGHRGPTSVVVGGTFTPDSLIVVDESERVAAARESRKIEDVA